MVLVAVAVFWAVAVAAVLVAVAVFWAAADAVAADAELLQLLIAVVVASFH